MESDKLRGFESRDFEIRSVGFSVNTQHTSTRSQKAEDSTALLLGRSPGRPSIRARIRKPDTPPSRAPLSTATPRDSPNSVLGKRGYRSISPDPDFETYDTGNTVARDPNWSPVPDNPLQESTQKDPIWRKWHTELVDSLSYTSSIASTRSLIPKNWFEPKPTIPEEVMSRGGRGGARGGILKGTGWDYDPTLKLDSRPSELFPAREIPFSSALTAQEKREIRNYMQFRSRVHKGPLYTKPRKRNPGERRKIYSEDQDNDRYAAKDAGDFDPFTGVPTWSMKYEQKQRAIPVLSEQPFIKENFPKELWDTITGVPTTTNKKSNLSSNRTSTFKRKENQSILQSAKSEEERRAAIAKLTEGIDENDLDEELMKDPDDADEEELDDDYEGAEGEMGGDYDAEQYFDNGEDDDDDGDGGGGGDDY